MTDRTDMTPQELAEACAATLWSGDHATQGLDMELGQVGPGRAEMSMTLTQAMCNGHGMAHGGYIFTLADSAFAFACNTYNQVTVAQHCAITYLAPGALGDRLTAVAREISRKGRSGLYDIQVRRADGEVIAEFRGQSRSLGKPLLPEAK